MNQNDNPDSKRIQIRNAAAMNKKGGNIHCLPLQMREAEKVQNSIEVARDGAGQCVQKFQVYVPNES